MLNAARVQQLASSSDPTALRRGMATEVRRGLVRRRREVPSKYLYDERGCQLFDEITRLPEYYLTRAETEILRASSDEIAAIVRPEVIVELGAGYSTKTRLLIASALRAGTLSCFVPTDVSPAAIEESVRSLPREFPGLQVPGVIAEFEHVGRIPRYGRQLVIFLGSTIGNLNGRARATLLRRIRRKLAPDDWFLLGVDLIKDPRELNAAYNDTKGITAAFTHNLLRVLNRELGADFDLADFEHVAGYHSKRRRVEIYLRALRAHSVHLAACELQVDLTAGELVRTEISVKFERQSLSRDLEQAGLRLRYWFTDPVQRFAMALASP